MEISFNSGSRLTFNLNDVTQIGESFSPQTSSIASEQLYHFVVDPRFDFETRFESALACQKVRGSKETEKLFDVLTGSQHSFLTRGLAAVALQPLGDQAIVNELIQYVRVGTPQTRALGMLALSRSREEAVLNGAHKLFAIEDLEIQLIALHLFAGKSDPRTLETLRERALTSPDAVVVEGALRVVRLYKPSDLELDRTLATLKFLSTQSVTSALADRALNKPLYMEGQLALFDRFVIQHFRQSLADSAGPVPLSCAEFAV